MRGGGRVRRGRGRCDGCGRERKKNAWEWLRPRATERASKREETEKTGCTLRGSSGFVCSGFVWWTCVAHAVGQAVVPLWADAAVVRPALWSSVGSCACRAGRCACAASGPSRARAFSSKLRRFSTRAGAAGRRSKSLDLCVTLGGGCCSVLGEAGAAKSRAAVAATSHSPPRSWPQQLWWTPRST